MEGGQFILNLFSILLFCAVRSMLVYSLVLFLQHHLYFVCGYLHWAYELDNMFFAESYVLISVLTGSRHLALYAYCMFIHVCMCVCVCACMCACVYGMYLCVCMYVWYNTSGIFDD